MASERTSSAVCSRRHHSAVLSAAAAAVGRPQSSLNGGALKNEMCSRMSFLHAFKSALTYFNPHFIAGRMMMSSSALHYRHDRPLRSALWFYSAVQCSSILDDGFPWPDSTTTTTTITERRLYSRTDRVMSLSRVRCEHLHTAAAFFFWCFSAAVGL